MTRSSELVPSVAVPRLLIVALVAIGGVVSVASEGRVSTFAGGFAAGAGAVLVVGSLRSRREPPLEEPGAGSAP